MDYTNLVGLRDKIKSQIDSLQSIYKDINTSVEQEEAKKRYKEINSRFLAVSRPRASLYYENGNFYRYLQEEEIKSCREEAKALASHKDGTNNLKGVKILSEFMSRCGELASYLSAVEILTYLGVKGPFKPPSLAFYRGDGGDGNYDYELCGFKVDAKTVNGENPGYFDPPRLIFASKKKFEENAKIADYFAACQFMKKLSEEDVEKNIPLLIKLSGVSTTEVHSFPMGEESTKFSGNKFIIRNMPEQGFLKICLEIAKQ